MLRLYNTVLLPLQLAVGIWATWQTRGGRDRIEWDERRARVLPDVPPGGAWIHGASVGEARIVTDVARALRARLPRLPLAVSCITRTGRGRLPSPPDVDAAFHAPLDFTACVRNVLGAVRPSVLTLIETELWPNLLHQTALSGIPVVLLNGRLSESRMQRYRRLASLYRPLLGGIQRLGVQSDEDARRFVELGAAADAVVVTGSIKYDLDPPAAEARTLCESSGIDAARPVFVAGSTGPGEELHVLHGFAAARRVEPDLLLVLAPRHPKRVGAVEELLRQARLSFRRQSENVRRAEPLDVLLVDTVGQLAQLYRLARVAFVGGSLIPVGGHNVLEPAAVGVPVLFGPHTESVAQPADALLRCGAARRVRDGDDLGRVLVELLGNEALRDEMSRSALGVVQANRGALARNVDLVVRALERDTPNGAA